MRSILCYLLFAIGGTVTYVCAEEKEQIGSDTLENILFVDDFDAKCIVPDTAIWKLCTYANNAWSQYFRGVDGYENVKVEEGYLKLRACKDNGTYKNGGVFSKIGFPCGTRLEVNQIGSWRFSCYLANAYRSTGMAQRGRNRSYGMGTRES